MKRKQQAKEQTGTPPPVENTGAAELGLLQAIFDKSPVAMILLDDSNRIVIANEMAKQLTGYEIDELTSMNAQSITHPDYYASAENERDELLAGNRSTYEFECKLLRKNEDEFWAQINVYSIGQHEKLKAYRIAHLRDIEQLKSSQLADKRIDALFVHAQKLGKLGYWEWNEVEQRMITCSDEYANIHGRSAEEIIAHNHSLEASFESIHPDDLERVKKFEEEFTSQNELREIQYRIIRPDGEIRYVYQVGEVERDAQGNPLRSFGILQDISEREHSNLRLLKHDLMFRRSEELGGVGHWEWDEVEDRLSWCSEHYARIFGMTVEEALKFSSSHENDMRDIHPDDYDLVYQADLDSADKGKRIDIEYRVFNTRGEIRYLHRLSDVEKNSEGKVIRTFGTIQDITDRKLAELELKKRQDMFERSEKLGGVGHWQWDEVEDRLTYCSPEYANIFGSTVEEIMAESQSHTDDVSDIHPDDRKYVVDRENEAVLNGAHLDIEYRIFNKRGETRYVHQLADFFKDKDGNITRSFGTLQDITEKKLAELTLQEERRKFERSEKLGNIGHWEWDEIKDTLTYCSPQYIGIYGHSIVSRMKKASYYQHIHPEDRERVKKEEDDSFEEARSHDIRFRIVKENGEVRYIRQQGEVETNHSGRVIRSFGTSQDITDTVLTAQELEHSRIQFKQTFSNAPIGMALVELDGTTIEFNQAGASMLGLEVKDTIGLNIDSLSHPAERNRNRVDLSKLRRGIVERYHVVRRLRHKNGNYIWIDLHCILVRDAESAPSYIIVQGMDITEQKLLTEKLNYNASHDSLTNLINRRELEQRLNRLIDSAITTGSVHSFCYMDLDQFKIINDTFGHAAGDELLRQLCGLIQSGIRSRDTLARLGGDEFGLLMEHCESRDAINTAENLRNSINDFRFIWDDNVLSVGVSMGIVTIDGNAGTSDDLLKAADSACYMAKDEGRNRIRVYAESDSDLAVRQSEMEWANKINEALLTDNLFLVAQPIDSLHSERKENTFYEILLRMKDERGNLISASAMLSAAERFGLITRIDKWVIAEACRSILSNNVLLEKIELCSINLSGHSITDMEFLEYIESTVEKYHVPQSKICFEITETSAISNFSQACKFMETLRARGFYFALDDFGTGLSSFAYLKKLPVDFIKIDGAFIQDIMKDPTDMALVKSINELGHVFGKKTIAECVESPEILECVRNLGIDYAQGYCIGMPGTLVNVPSLKIVN